MPEAETLRRARRDAAEGKSPSTQAGEFVREEIHHVREGKHGARSAKQAIAIGLSKARRAGVDLPAPRKGSRKTRRAAARDRARGKRARRASPKRAKASLRKLKREGRRSASKTALSRQAHRVARSQSAATRSARAKKAAATRRRRR
jgi:hypothetical protein